jgi:hypothetical protein
MESQEESYLLSALQYNERYKENSLYGGETMALTERKNVHDERRERVRFGGPSKREKILGDPVLDKIRRNAARLPGHSPASH